MTGTKLFNETPDRSCTILPAGRVEFRASAGRVLCSALPGSRAASFIVSPCEGKTVGLGKRYYRGYIYIRTDGAGLRIVNETTMEDYVQGALRAEGAASFKPEMQKALAVAVRTYALRCRGKHAAQSADVCDTTHCQGFSGVADTGGSWMERASLETRGQVLTWENVPIWSVYSTDCGGATASNEDGGMGSSPFPYLRGVTADDSDGRHDCEASPHHAWVARFPASRVESLLNRSAKTRIGRLKAVQVERADTFGRAVMLRLDGVIPAPERRSETGKQPLSGSPAKPTPSSGSSKTSDRPPSAPAAAMTPPARSAGAPSAVSAPPVTVNVPPSNGDIPSSVLLPASRLRGLLGADSLKSTVFSVKMENNELVFHGRGYGHGVGMCLYGANGLAKRGLTYREILARYYTGAILVDRLDLAPDPLAPGGGSTSTGGSGP